MTSMDLEIVDLTEFVGDMPIMCDYADAPECKGDPAAWVLHFKCCDEGSGCRLACDTCKDVRLFAQIAVYCPACGHVFMHAPEAYSRIEPLERK